MDCMAETVAGMTSFLQYSSDNLGGDNESPMTALRGAIRKQPSQMGYTTMIQESVPGVGQTNELANAKSRPYLGKLSHLSQHFQPDVV